jgi:hypothetical protein
MPPLDGHESHCSVWNWVAGERFLNNARPCTCGFREQVAEEKRTLTARNRALKPLGMDEDSWLRTLGIDPVH